MENITADDFISQFRNKKITFVLAILDESNRSIENIEQFDSNVAKLALTELVQDMRNLNVEFQICQIQKQTATND